MSALSKERLKRWDFLPCLTLCFCLGICLVEYRHLPFPVLYAFAWILLIFSAVVSNKEGSVWLLLLLGLLLGSLCLKGSYTLAADHIARLPCRNSAAPARLTGDVAGYPAVSRGRTVFVLNAGELSLGNKTYRVTGKVLVRIFREQDIGYGKRVVLSGRLSRPCGWIGRRLSYRGYLKRKGIYSLFTVGKDTPLEYSGKGRMGLVRSFAYKARRYSRDIFYAYLPPAPAGLFSAMILGERSRIPPYFNSLFVQTGTVHILAISGLHIGIVVFSLDLLLKAARIRRRPRHLLIIPFLAFYCLLTGARASVLRASLMAIILLAGFLLKRRVNISYSLSLAALVILIVNPHQLFDVGFQLSFLSVISIVYLSPAVKNLFLKFGCFNISGLRGRIGGFFLDALSVSLSVWLGLCFAILHYFRIISPVAVLANLIVVPCLSLIIALGLTLLAVASVLPGCGPLFALPANLSIAVLLQVVRFFNKLPFAYFYLS